MLSNSVSFVNKKLCRAEVFSGILTNLPKEPGHNQIKQLKGKLVTRKGCFRSKTKKKSISSSPFASYSNYSRYQVQFSHYRNNS